MSFAEGVGADEEVGEDAVAAAAYLGVFEWINRASRAKFEGGLQKACVAPTALRSFS